MLALLGGAVVVEEGRTAADLILADNVGHLGARVAVQGGRREGRAVQGARAAVPGQHLHGQAHQVTAATAVVAADAAVQGERRSLSQRGDDTFPSSVHSAGTTPIALLHHLTVPDVGAPAAN